MKQFRLPISAVILLDGEGAALLQLRDRKPGLRHGGLWAFPGGHGEPGEDLADCARREFLEETGYRLAELNWLASACENAEDDEPYPLHLYWARYDGQQEFRCLEGQDLKFIRRGETHRYPVVAFLLKYWDLALQRMKEMDVQLESLPYVNFMPQVAEVKAELLRAVERVLDGGMYILGPEVAAFEKEFAAYCGTEFSVGVSNGTSALYLALRALGVGEGHEVITVSNSFIATASAPVLAGARPVFVDVGPDMNMDPSKIETAITPRTRAIIPVHLTGRPARMEEILSIARKRGLYAIEDAAQAVGARLNGRRVGSFGNMGCFSLHPLKNLHAYGDAGMITTNDARANEELRKLRNIGLRNRQDCQYWSFNCRLDELQAAMLRINLRQLDRRTDERRKLALRYHRLLKPYGAVPEEGKGEFHVYQTYMIRIPRRDDLLKFLEQKKIDAKIHYPVPIHRQEVALGLPNQDRDLPETLKAASEIMSLPLWPGMTEEQQDRVRAAFQEFYAR